MTSAASLRALPRVFALAALALLPIASVASAQQVVEAPAAGTGSIEKGTTAQIEAPAVRRETPAGYMKRVGNELLTASRTGSVSQMAMVLNSNADIPSIGLSALGDYARSLPKTDRQPYYNGMINFIARYAAKEAPKYPVARFIVTAQSKDDPRGTYVDSRITLASGDGYDIRWLVVKRGETYKVRDAQVIGFWMTSFLDNLFQTFISDNGGNPKALVVALNR
jgi:phospholipid transport system substrate-binding protein